MQNGLITNFVLGDVKDEVVGLAALVKLATIAR